MNLNGDEWILMEMNIQREMEGGRDGWMDMNGGECMEIHAWMEVGGQMHGWAYRWMDGNGCTDKYINRSMVDWLLG